MELIKAKVHMLPTEDIKHAPIFLASNGVINTRVNVHSNHLENRTPQHLYITTDEEIKEGDWFIDLLHNKVRKCRSVTELFYWHEPITGTSKDKARKIIASTDPKLIKEHCIMCNGKGYLDSEGFQECDNCDDGEEILLSQPSQSFIEEYCKLGGIDEVDVEYEEIVLDANIENSGIIMTQTVLKVDNHNTITIHPIKDNSKILKALQRFWINEVVESCVEYKDLENWIKENL